MNEITNVKTTEFPIVDIKEEMARLSEEQRVGMQASISRIQFKAGQITCDGQSIGTKMICYILAYRMVHAWYLNKYNPDLPEAPQCWSIFKKVDERNAGPNENSPMPQNSHCLSCTKYAFGSNRDGRKSKDCSNTWRLLVVPAGVPNKDGYEFFDAPTIEAQPTYAVRVPVMSGKNFVSYTSAITNTIRIGRPLFGVITELELVPDAKAQFKVKFNLVAVPAIDSEEIKVLFERAAIAETEVEYGFESIPVAKPEVTTNKF